MAERTENIDESELLLILKFLDTDGNEALSVEEFRQALKESMDNRLDEEKFLEMISEADIDGDGQISFKELIRMMKSNLPELKRSDKNVEI